MPGTSRPYPGRFSEVDTVKRWRALTVLGSAQFRMVLAPSVL
ncbi:hypothetical protein ACWGBH_20605 [Streptomyces massasporeus]